MTTEAPTTQTPAPTPAPATPPVDVAKITADATTAAIAATAKAAEESATKLAAQKLSAIGKALAGEEAEDPNKAVLRALISDPISALNTAAKKGEERALKAIREEREIERTQVAVSSKFVPEYPGLNSPKKLAAVERYAEDYMNQGKPYAEALEMGFKDAITEFGLKSVTEEVKSGTMRGVGLPSGGGYGSTTSKVDPEKGQQDFLAGMRAKANSFRVKK